MHPLSRKNKLIAVFLVVFVCLNAAGAVCVAYCRSTDTAAVQPDHCPLKKKTSHCDPDKGALDQAKADAIGSDRIDCCPMTVSIVAAPIEKNTFSFEPAAMPVSVKSEPRTWVLSPNAMQRSQPAYRGPPRDQSSVRLKNCVIRI